MTIQSPWLRSLFGRTAAWCIRTWMATLRYETLRTTPAADPAHPDCQPSIYVHWHEYMMTPLYLRGNCRVTILVSQHRDADILESFAQWSGFPCVRGSSFRGGASALRKLVDREKTQHMVLASDGPRGPRHKMSPGAIYLASKLGKPIVPIGFAMDNAWRMKSWDRFALPKPFSTARIVMGDPIPVPPDLTRDQIETTRQEVEAVLTKLTESAEAWARTKETRPGSIRSYRPRRLIAPIKAPPESSTNARSESAA